MENKHGVAPTDVDPQADLDLLQRAKSSVDVDHVLDFGPWWYAPLIATCLAGATLFGQDFSTATSFILGGLGLVSGIVAAAHDYGRRTIRPKFSIRSSAMLAVIVLIVFVILGLWGSAVSNIGADRFLPWYAALGWTLTTAFFLAIRSGSYWLRNRRTVLA